MERKRLNNKQYLEMFDKEINEFINTLKRFREIWNDTSYSRDYEVFQYADSDYYFYDYSLSRLEASTNQLLDNIIYNLLISFKIPFRHLKKRNKKNLFTFIIPENGRNIGYKFSSFYEDEDVNSILRKYKIDKGYIIRPWHKNQTIKKINQENNQYKIDHLRIRDITLEDFFNKYFGSDVYNDFLNKIEDYLRSVKEIMGYKSVKFLSYVNYSNHIKKVEKTLIEFSYKSYRYQIIDDKNKDVKDYLIYIKNGIPEELISSIKNNYLTEELYKTMFGKNDYAESFKTSEWLFDSINGKNNFDFTSVTSGYLKSIEQLLYMIVMINVDNSCKIRISGDKRKPAKETGVTAYKYNEKNHWKKLDQITGKYPYMDLISCQVKYMDNSIGSFEYFLRYNPHIFLDSNLASTIAAMIGTFRTECRNGYFHKHNLNDWNIVKIIRSNAIYLYFLLLGACIIPNNKKGNLGIMNFDYFDELCLKIRDFKHHSIRYVFIDKNGREQKLMYDPFTNIKKYNDKGMEHYEYLLFYKVDDFSLDTYEKLNEGLYDDHKYYLTRNTLPHKIFGVHRDKSLEELFSDI